jgi:hypothetical protein
MNDLEARIMELEKRQVRQMAELKETAVGIVESFSPSNMLKSALHDVARSPDLRNSAINTAIGIGAGFLGKKLYVGNSRNIFKKVAGSAVQFLIANFVRKKIPEIRENNLLHNHEA